MKETGKFLTTLTAIVFTLAFVSISAAGSDFKIIDTTQLHSLVVDNAYSLEAGQAPRHVIVDARTKKDYDESHVATAVCIPETDFEKSSALLPKDKGDRLIVYGNDVKAETSRKWADRAATAGYTNIVIYSEGFTNWKRNKMPIAPI